MNYDPHPYRIWRQRKGDAWYHLVNEPGCFIHAAGADEAVRIYLAEQTCDASGNYIVESCKTGLLLHLTVKPRNDYVIERS